MFSSFQAQPDLKPYAHVVPDVDLKATNRETAWGAKLSEKMDFSVEDAADDLLLNEVIWRSVRGPNSPMPPPVRSAFVFPRLKADGAGAGSVSDRLNAPVADTSGSDERRGSRSSTIRLSSRSHYRSRSCRPSAGREHSRCTGWGSNPGSSRGSNLAGRRLE